MLTNPAGIAAGFANGIFQVGHLLLERFDLGFFGIDFGVFFVDIGTIVLLHQGFLRIGIILDFVFAEFALQDVEFLFGGGEFGVKSPGALVPIGFLFRIVFRIEFFFA